MSPIADPEKEGHTFCGWDGVPSTMPARDVEVTGSFAAKVYAITYYVDGEEWAADSVAYGAEVKPFEVPEKEGYTFGGWSEIPATMPAEDVVVTGMFTAIEDGVGELRKDADGTLTVYSLTGRIVRKACGYNEAVKGLPRGVYIIGGRKVKL